MQNPTKKNKQDDDNDKIHGSKKRNNPVDNWILSSLGDDDCEGSSARAAAAPTPENNTNIHFNTENRKDMLDLLFSKQNELYKKQLDNSENKMKNLYKIKEPFEGYRLFMLSTALVHEAIELQRETNWKWWKKENSLESKKIQEEIIDIWHFLIQLSIEAGLDSRKLIELYIKKNKENLNRQIKGY
jgi:dimeric dUTPase (all-alpha-NTP-PPase superfamily)